MAKEKEKESAEAQENKDTKTIRETYDFEYIFSEDEITQKSKELAHACTEKEELENSKKSVMSDFKAKIDVRTAKINLLSNHISTGKQWISRTCDCIMNFKTGIKSYYYEGKKVGEAKMTRADYQMEIPMDKSTTSNTPTIDADIPKNSIQPNTDFDTEEEFS